MIMNKINGFLKGKGLVMSVSLFHLFTFSPLSAQEKQKSNGASANAATMP